MYLITSTNQLTIHLITSNNYMYLKATINCVQ